MRFSKWEAALRILSLIFSQSAHTCLAGLETLVDCQIKSWFIIYFYSVLHFIWKIFQICGKFCIQVREKLSRKWLGSVIILMSLHCISVACGSHLNWSVTNAGNLIFINYNYHPSIWWSLILSAKSALLFIQTSASDKMNEWRGKLHIIKINKSKEMLSCSFHLVEETTSNQADRLRVSVPRKINKLFQTGSRQFVKQTSTKWRL